MSVNPHLVDRRRIYEGRIFTVTVDRVALDGGRTVEFEIVRHPGSVVLIPMPDEKRVTLVRQYRYAIGQWIWELPAGSLDPGEDPEAAARRECHEEIGLIPRGVERLWSFFPTPGFCTEEMIFYKLTGLEPPPAPAAQDEDEQIEPRVFTLAAARRMIETGEIVDMKTVVGLTLADRLPGNAR